MTEPIRQSGGIEIVDLKKSFGDTVVFDGLSLLFAETGVTAIMGASGCGKTTLLSMILGLEKPDGGEIRHSFRAISCAFQDPRLVPWLTAKENVAFVLKALPRAEKQQRAEEILSSLGLADALDKLPSELSGGMQQRVSLARAFAAPADLLILDEPFRGLDEGNKALVMEKIRKIAEQIPILLVTHEISDAEALDATVISL